MYIHIVYYITLCKKNRAPIVLVFYAYKDLFSKPEYPSFLQTGFIFISGLVFKQQTQASLISSTIFFCFFTVVIKLNVNDFDAVY